MKYCHRAVPFHVCFVLFFCLIIDADCLYSHWAPHQRIINSGGKNALWFLSDRTCESSKEELFGWELRAHVVCRFGEKQSRRWLEQSNVTVNFFNHKHTRVMPHIQHILSKVPSKPLLVKKNHINFWELFNNNNVKIFWFV